MNTPTSLLIHIHHARNIHNICIYASQDVYAKFSLTTHPDLPVSTPPIPSGGQNPLFHHLLRLPLPPLPLPSSPLLKCELWMLSQSPSLLQDQLLCFSLIPLSSLPLSGHLTREFSLSSTDLFHSPAGTVKLTLSFDDMPCLEPQSTLCDSSSISSEFVILVPEIGVDEENREMVSEYFADCESSSVQNSTVATNLDGKEGNVFKYPLIEEEERGMQKQIVEMYMRSMQQFTESLAKMKLPMDVDDNKLEDDGDVIQKLESSKKDGSRVFYGSRAFF